MNMATMLKGALADFNLWYLEEGFKLDRHDGQAVGLELMRRVHALCPPYSFIEGESVFWSRMTMDIQGCFCVNLDENRAALKVIPNYAPHRIQNTARHCPRCKRIRGALDYPCVDPACIADYEWAVAAEVREMARNMEGMEFDPVEYEERVRERTAQEVLR